MTKRTHYVVDRKFQLKTTFSILGIIFLAGVVIISSIGITIAVNNKRLNNVIIIHNNIVEALITYSQDVPGAKENPAIKNASEINARNIEVINRIILQNDMMLLAIIGFIILLGIIIFFMLIRMTHRISGPAMVMSNYIRQIIQGTYPSTRPLRKDDELQDLYELFQEMVRKLKDQDKK